MILREKISFEGGSKPLCRTFSTGSFKLRQKETGVIYDSSVIDVIEGYDEEGKPFSRFTYEETDEKSEDAA